MSVADYCQSMVDRIDFDDLTRFLDRWDAAARAGDAAALTAMCAPNVVYDDGGPEREIEGRAAVEELIGALIVAGVPDLERRDLFLSDDGSAGGVMYRGTYPVSGRELESVELYEFEGGLLSRWTVFVRDLDWTGTNLP